MKQIQPKFCEGELVLCDSVEKVSEVIIRHNGGLSSTADLVEEGDLQKLRRLKQPRSVTPKLGRRAS